MSEWNCSFVLKAKKWPFAEVVKALEKEGCKYNGSFSEFSKGVDVKVRKEGLKEAEKFFAKGGVGTVGFECRKLGLIRLYFTDYPKTPAVEIAAQPSVLTDNRTFESFVKLCSTVSEALEYRFGLDSDSSDTEETLKEWDGILSKKKKIGDAFPYMIFIGRELFGRIDVDRMRTAGIKITIFDNGALLSISLPQDLEKSRDNREAVRAFF